MQKLLDACTVEQETECLMNLFARLQKPAKPKYQKQTEEQKQEKIKEYNKKYNKENAKKIKDKRAKNYKENPEKFKERVVIYRAKKKAEKQLIKNV